MNDQQGYITGGLYISDSDISTRARAIMTLNNSDNALVIIRDSDANTILAYSTVRTYYAQCFTPTEIQFHLTADIVILTRLNDALGKWTVAVVVKRLKSRLPAQRIFGADNVDVLNSLIPHLENTCNESVHVHFDKILPQVIF